MTETDNFAAECEVNGRRCHIFGSADAPCCVICGMGNHEENEAADTAKLLYGQTAPDACRLVIFETDDWNGDFSPWPSAAVFGDEGFAGNAPAMLDWLCGSLLPHLKEQKLLAEESRIYLAGYSLSGLFALWAFLESDAFDGAASCSGSLWFPGWMDYIRKKPSHRSGIVYLSLGSREEKTKNPVMAAIGDCTRETYRILKDDSDIEKTTLTWNKGGHFANPAERLVKGILWLLQNTMCT